VGLSAVAVFAIPTAGVLHVIARDLIAFRRHGPPEMERTT